MSSIMPSAHVAKPTLGEQTETSQYERQNTRTSLTTPNRPVTLQNTQPMHTRGTLRALRKPFSEENNGRPANCKPTLNEQAHSVIVKLFPSRIT